MELHQQRFFAASALALVLGMTGAASAQFDFRGGGRERTAEQLTRVQIVLDTVDPIMPGETIHLAVVFTIEPTWHLYWKNPGEGAMPPRVTVEAPEGFTVGQTRWPRPKALSSPVGDMYCYEGEFALFVPITAPDDLNEGEIELSVNADWAVCDNHMCLFGTAKRTARLQTTSSTLRTLEARPTNPLITKHRQRLSQPLSDDATVELRGETIHITVDARDYEQVRFFPHQSPGVNYGEPSVKREGERFEVLIDLEVNPNNFLNDSPAVGGLIALGEKPDDPSYEFSLPLSVH